MLEKFYNEKLSSDVESYGAFRFWDGKKWHDELIPKDVIIKDMFVENQKTIWLAGYDGNIYVGNAEDGFHKRSWSGQTPNLYSITKFKDEIIVADDRKLFRFDGDMLSPLKPRVKMTETWLSPLKVQAVDDVMYYFDYNLGIYIWDGDKTWKNIPIPKALLERKFKGL